MADVATITLRMNTGELERGNKVLDEFRNTATTAAKTADNLNSSFRAGADSQKKSAASTREQKQELQALLNKISPVNKALDELDTIQKSLSKFRGKGLVGDEDFTRYNSVLETTRAKLARVMDAETAEGRARLEQARSVQQAAAAREKFIRQLKEQAAAQSLSRSELLRQRAAQLGAGSAAEIYIRKLEQTGQATHSLGLKSAAARREIGVLIGELARGNLGALRGSGITLANRAGWIEQLMTLRGLGIAGVIGGIAAATYTLGRAWYEGNQESIEFNKQLILTGNYAGKTAGELGRLAKSISGNGVTQGAAAGVLAQVVGSGKFNSQQIETVTRAAVAMQHAVGRSVDETVRNFEKLYTSPTAASEELNQRLHYLTAAQYDYISSLERRGDKEAAGEAAANAYSAAEQRRSEQVLNNLGLIERATRAAADSWKAYWDSLLGIGRAVTDADRLEAVKRRIKEIESPVRPGAFGLGNIGDRGASSRELAALREQEKNLEFVIRSHEAYNRAAAAARQVQEQGIKDQQKVNEWMTAGTTAAEKRKRALDELNKSVKRNAQLAKETANLPKDQQVQLWTPEQIAKARAGIEKLYKDPKTTKTKTPTVKVDAGDKATESAQRELLALQTQLEVLQKHREANDTISKQRQDLWAAEAQYTVLQKAAQRRQLTAQEQSLLASKKETLEHKRQLAALGDQITGQQKLNQLHQQATKFIDQQNAKLAEIRMLAKGGTPEQAQREAVRARLREQYKNNPEERDSVLSKQEETWAKEDQLQKDWLAGAKRGWGEYKDTATNVYTQMQNISQNAFTGMATELTNFFTTGKASFGDFLNTFLKGTAQMLVQLAMVNSMKTALGGTAVGAFFGFADGGYTGDGGKHEPKGVVHGGEFVFTKEATNRLGVSNLYALMHNAQGYANGGYVGKAPMYGLQPAAAASVNVNVGDIVIQGSQQQQPTGGTDVAAANRQLKEVIISTVTREAMRQGTPLFNLVNKRGR